MKNKIASANDVELEEGDTKLSLIEKDGNVFVVDQHGKLVNGTISCSGTTAADKFTTLTLTCHAYKLEA